ncbi:MAG: sulfatase-like hydrolase/transferase [Candidatus Acidiferrales bacterium]|jgi:hypothetical protein
MSLRKNTLDEGTSSDTPPHTSVRATGENPAGTPLEPGVANASHSEAISKDSVRPATQASRRAAPWLDSALFLIAWLPAAAMGVYVKWYTMTNLGGFSKAARFGGYISLTLGKRIAFFDGEIIIGFVLIPIALWILNHYLGRYFAVAAAAILSIGYLILFAVQLQAMQEVGRYISLHIIGIALNWGIHEPGANLGYLSARGVTEVLLALAAIIGSLVWSFKRQGHNYSSTTIQNCRVAGELYVLAIVIVLAAGRQTSEFHTPYHESTFVRAVASLWKEKAVDTGEFLYFSLDSLKQLDIKTLSTLPTPDLIERYRALAHVPAPETDPRYFGKEQGDNVLFFVLETAPSEFVPPDDDLSQFPNMRRLREKSFLGTRHYTTLPFTQCALFSVFSSWYPLDTLHAVRGYPEGDIPPDFLYRLNAMGFESAAFTPLMEANNPDEAIYAAVGFKDHFYLDPNAPLPAVPSLAGQDAWKAHRVGADMVTLQNLETHIDGWIRSRQRYVAAFLPQVGHFPYPDAYPENSEEDLHNRGRAIIAMQDAWLGQVMDFLEKRGQLDHTIILVFGDHGRRNARENPDLRRGTIDETAFHVPLLIYAPRTLDHTERIPWITSHIDLAPTVLDLLGIKREEETAQGTAMWNPALPGRTTFFFAQPLFGADGFAAQDKFYMWHYYSDMVYENKLPFFDDSNFIMRQSPIARDVTSKIRTMIDLQATWQSRFARPPAK